MSYKITVRVFQTNPNAHFRVVEETIFNYANGGTWSRVNDELVLQMGGSGTSGTLRFQSDTNEDFIVALGIHNYKRWGDIVTNLSNSETGVIIHPQYYSAATKIGKRRESQLASYSVKNAKGRQFAINYIVAEGNDLKVNIIIG